MDKGICKLCEVSIANKKGSHIIPNFLLQSAFGIDGGRSRRNKDAIVTMGLVCDVHIGRELLPEETATAIGRELTDNEIENNASNPFIVDYYFCSECEKRFAVIESLYAAALPKQYPKFGVVDLSIDGYLSHLFWLSVLWRISISPLMFSLSNSQTQQFRKLLNNSLSLDKKKIVLNGIVKQKLQHISYFLMYFEIDNAEKGLQMGVSFPSADDPKFCNIIQIGTYTLVYYPQISKSLPTTFSAYAIERDLTPDKLNKSTKSEKIVCFNSLAHECIASLTQKRMEKEMIAMIQEFVMSTYGKECSNWDAKKILFDYFTPVAESGGDIFKLNQENLFKVLERKYGTDN